ncbi:TrlF family AAA-like ATPase [Zavarzinella formosa]|uniref:TrlF family AAA-like ATPase n=1 Tax=Zavarzinella formosa TaxID=360055 RepID=UPI000308677F|nr:AAA family ATPase [Zavarzinella formosa]
MDKGARYYHCDFQVHTPRDTSWKGARPQTEEARVEYAESFIKACRAKGLDAVAITDHHDLCYFPYIKAAAKEEVWLDGERVPESRQIVVFPGVELTLAVPCQALLIFDAEIPIEVLPNLYPLLGVTQNPNDSPVHAEIGRLDAITSFDELISRLDCNDCFRGRYIILPNVGGHGHMMREGFTSIYKSMPCVGGYLDKLVSKLDPGTKRVLDGKIEAYGNKRLGLFQTSDNRQADFSHLGAHTTWVKWATPTAGALRQACLACDTRISHAVPVTPTMAIVRLEVSDCKFLGPIDVRLNPQYSCLIGGRGTGKSTILEYMRWALCDQPPNFSDEDDAVPYQEKRAALIEKTLAPHQGVVSVTFLLNSVLHVVRRSSETKELKLKVGTDEFRECNENQVRDLLPVQAYSQKQLSAVGIRSEELIRFIRTSIKGDLDHLSHAIDECKTGLRGVFGGLVRMRKLRRDIDRDGTELASLTQQVEALMKGIKGLTEEERQVLEKHDLYLREEQYVEKIGRELRTAQEQAADFRKELAGFPSSPPTGQPLPNADLLAGLHGGMAAGVAAAALHVEAAAAALDDTSPGMVALETVRAQWRERYAEHLDAYERAKLNASSQKDILKQIAEADAKIRELRAKIDVKESELERYGSSEEDFRLERRRLIELQTTVADMMQVKCDELTEMSTGRIKAGVVRGAGSHKINDRLIGLVSGTGMRTKKVDELCGMVTGSANPLQTWSDVADELESLIDYSGGVMEDPKPRHTPLLTQAGFAARDLDRIASKSSPELWVELALADLDDVPQFQYRQSEGLYIQFTEASAGQQATALLRVLLNQEGPPLVIDQPEEDLDNQVIQQIVHEIWKAKCRRQLIFSSHNANIVVNGDADLVICCDYRTAGDHSGGKIKCCGAIDIDEINEEITVVMEGGRDAFDLRKKKYGF